MGKKIILLITILLALTLILSGCTSENKIEQVSPIKIPNNPPPVPQITSLEKAYFGEKIEFDASKSYDDGEVVRYEWNFMDGITDEGEIVEHIFEFNSEYNVEYPIIYTIALQVTDNSGTIAPAFHQIKLYPKSFVFYLDTYKLTDKLPSQSYESTRAAKSLTYNFETPVEIQESEYSLKLFLEKKLLSKINKIKIEFIDDSDNIVHTDESSIFLNKYWKNKEIEINGNINSKITLKSIKIIPTSISLFNQINILYGDEEASSISFEFDY